MTRNSLVLLLFVTAINAYGIVRLQQNVEEELGAKDVMDTDGEFSYIVSLQERTPGPDHTIIIVRQCIGSAITRRWVLTAGHCITNKLSHVEYGEKEPKNITRIISKQLHPGYRMDYSFGGYYAILNNNIALIKVEGMSLQKYGRLSAREYSTLLGEVVKYAGYGGIWNLNAKKKEKEKGKEKESLIKEKENISNNATRSKNKKGVRQNEDTTKKLKQEIEVRSPEELRIGAGGIIKCERERYIIFQPAICVAPKCGNRKHKTSQGDSGGPLTLDKKIIGVSSGNSPIMNDIFTPLSPFFEWISNTIKEKHY